MDTLQRAKNFIMIPKTEYPVIAAEEPNTDKIFKKYVLPLALIPAIAYIIGFGMIGNDTQPPIDPRKRIVKLDVVIESPSNSG